MLIYKRLLRFTNQLQIIRSIGMDRQQLNKVTVLAHEKKEGRAHLLVCRGVDDVIHRGRGTKNRHVSSFEMLDPVAELCPIQTGHHYGVDQFPWEERRGDKACHSVQSLTGMCFSQIAIH